jgi:16S rRNA processing protein RimM
MARRSISRSTDADQRPADDHVVVGVVRAPHGLRGEVKVEPLTDKYESRFRVGAKLICEGVGTVTIASLRGTEGQPIVRFAGYDDRNAVDGLRNKQLSVSRDQARKAAGDAYLWSDLIGLAVVTPDGRALGAVAEIIRAGETDVLVVRGETGETLLPALESVIREVDLAARRIVAVPQEELA